MTNELRKCNHIFHIFDWYRVFIYHFLNFKLVGLIILFYIFSINPYIIAICHAGICSLTFHILAYFWPPKAKNSISWSIISHGWKILFHGLHIFGNWWSLRLLKDISLLGMNYSAFKLTTTTCYKINFPDYTTVQVVPLCKY